MNPLEQLNDIYQPTELAWWPLAYGWWIAIALTVTVLVTAFFVIRRYYRLRSAKRHALKELSNIPSSAPPSAFNQLLKRAAIAYFPSLPTQGYYGRQWHDFLTSACPKALDDEQRVLVEQLATGLYQSSPSIDTAALHHFTQTWLSNALPPSGNTLKRLESQHV